MIDNNIKEIFLKTLKIIVFVIKDLVVYIKKYCIYPIALEYLHSSYVHTCNCTIHLNQSTHIGQTLIEVLIILYLISI